MSTKTNLWVDAAILAGFLVVFEPNLTGIPVHEWLGLALAATLIAHVVLHWDWTVRVSVRFFRRLLSESRLNLVLDLALFAAYVLVMLSGLMISGSLLPAAVFHPAASPAWHLLHSISASASLIVTGLHIALHWRWIAAAVRRYVVRSLGQ